MTSTGLIYCEKCEKVYNGYIEFNKKEEIDYLDDWPTLDLPRILCPNHKHYKNPISEIKKIADKIRKLNNEKTRHFQQNKKNSLELNSLLNHYNKELIK